MEIGVKTAVPGPKGSAAMDRGRFDMQAGYRKLVIDDDASRGCHLVDVDGNVYLDLFSNFALGALGYNHPALVEVASGEAFRRAIVNPTSTPFITTDAWLDFVDELGRRFAPDGMSSVFCVDGGGEAVESALKAAFIVHGEARRVAAGGPKNPLELDEATQTAILDNAGTDAVVVSFAGAFHGRGLGPLSATHSKLIHKADMPAFSWPMAPFPALRFPLERYAEENEAGEERCIEALERILDEHAGRVAAVLVEPIQSEGGDRHANPSFFRRARQLAADAGASFVFDEVQTGVGITGKLWAHQHFDLETPPDMMVFGKKMRLGGFFANERSSIAQFGRMYQTRNGDRAQAMLSRATLRTIEAEGLLDHVTSVGHVFLAGLEELAEKHPKLMSDARGRGLLLAFDMPTPDVRNRFLEASLAKGVFASYTGSRSVRLRPHLITAEEDVRTALSVFDATLREMT